MRTECAVARRCGSNFRVAGFLALIPVAFSSCQKPPVAEVPTPPPPVGATPIPLPSTTAPAASKPPVAPSTPAPPSHLAPPGVFFLVTKVSIETDSGITGLPPGTLVRQITPIEFTTNAGQKLTLRPDQITNDLRVARQMAGADAAAQAALRQAAAPRSATARAGYTTTAPSTTAAPAPVQSPRPVATPTPQPSATTSMGANGSLGSTHSRVKDGWLWSRTPDGTWFKVRPVR